MKVHLWQGEVDKNVRVFVSRRQARWLPNCQARFYPGEGHFLLIDRMEEILNALTAGFVQ